MHAKIRKVNTVKFGEFVEFPPGTALLGWKEKHPYPGVPNLEEERSPGGCVSTVFEPTFLASRRITSMRHE